jgi:hypothetical protein
VHDIRDSLRVRGGAGTAAVDALVDVGQLVCDTVCLNGKSVSQIFRYKPATNDVGAHGCATVSADDDSAVELDGHDRSL